MWKSWHENSAKRDTILYTLYNMRAEVQVSPCLTYAGKGHGVLLKFLTALHISTNDHENNMNSDFGITNKCQQVGKFAIQNPQIMRIDWRKPWNSHWVQV